MSATTRTEAETLAREAVLDPRVLTREEDFDVLEVAGRRAMVLAVRPLIVVNAAAMAALALLWVCLHTGLLAEGTDGWAVLVIVTTVALVWVQRVRKTVRAVIALFRAWNAAVDHVHTAPLGTIHLEVDAYFDEDGDVFARFVAVREHDLEPADVPRLAEEFVEDTHRVEDAIIAAYASRRDRIASATVLVDLTITSRGDELIAETARVTGEEGMVFHADRRRGVALDGDLSDLVDYALADLGESVR